MGLFLLLLLLFRIPLLLDLVYLGFGATQGIFQFTSLGGFALSALVVVVVVFNRVRVVDSHVYAAVELFP